MYKKFCKSLAIIFSSYVFLSYAKGALAIVKPSDSPNNPFGIHILDENDIEDAANLVNSEGGDWGYVTLVIRKDERDPKKWQKVFDKLREKHLIPIVRVATRQQNDGWEKPSLDEIDGWVSFLNSLNWVVKNRYVVVGNEPNHAKEWGGEINPEEYADYLIKFSIKLRERGSDFFVLPAGLDASAPNNSEHMSESTFLKRMFNRNNNVFDYIDGWTSHSYPNPNFSGSVSDEGRGSLKTYEWEMNLLKNLNVDKKFPIFITETGWAHNADYSKRGYFNEDTVASYLRYAYKTVWNDKRIVAVTPFVLNYQSSPFDIFSWKKREGQGFYDFYYEVQKIPKIKGLPVQINSGRIISILIPPAIRSEGKLLGIAYIENTGQSIWERDKSLLIKVNNESIEIKPISYFEDIVPKDKSLVFFNKVN